MHHETRGTAANPAARFAGRSAAVIADLLGLTRGVRRVYAAMMARARVRRALHAAGRQHRLDQARAKSRSHESHLAGVVRELVQLAKAGATNADLRRPGLFLGMIADVLSPVRAIEFDTLELEEARVDGREDELALRRRVRGMNPAALEEEIDVNLQASALLTARASYLQGQLAGAM